MFAASNDVTIKIFGELIAELRDEYREYSEALEIGKSELNGPLRSLIEATEPTIFCSHVFRSVQLFYNRTTRWNQY